MSEDFDKEAEREKLREKYERDKKKREATEQMSELLLQGATMTNAHCSECGDPVFRHDGQEFCPTCEKPVDRGQQDENTEDDQSDDDGDREQIEVTTPSGDARVAFGEEGSGETTDSQPAAEPPTSQEQESTREQPARPPEKRQPEPSQQPQRSQPASWQTPNKQPVQSTSSPDSETGKASVEAARATLVQTLTKFSQQAAATEDPHRAKEYLEAAHEAADALAALRR